jgi:thiol-disulfide isomerase/thioredoxin
MAVFLAASVAIQYWAHKSYRAGSRPAPRTGVAAPAWSLPDLERNAVSSSDLRGRIVVMSFWATWCEPCRREFAMLKSWRDAEQDSGLLNGVEFVAVNMGEAPSLVEQFVRANPIPARVVLDVEGKVAQTFGVRALPTLIVLDHDGTVVMSEVGYNALMGQTIADTIRLIEKRRARRAQ